MKRLLVTLAFAGIASTAHAVTQECKTDESCRAPERCIQVDQKHVCAQPCDPKASKCPANTRCVKDSPSFVCRPINDGLGL